MLHKKGLLTALLSLSASALVAYTPICEGQYEITGQFLYLLPSTGQDTEYATTAPNTNGYLTSVYNNFDFSPGFRVGAAYGISPTQAVNLSYTWLYATTGIVSVDNVAAGVTNFGVQQTVSSVWNTLYQDFKATFIQKTYNFSKLHLHTQGGLEAVYIKTYNSVVSALNGNIFLNRNRDWRFGPELGTGANYDLYRSKSGHFLSLFGDLSGSILTGQHSSTALVETEPYFLFGGSKVWEYTFGFHAEVGVDYTKRFSSFTLDLQVGYEFNRYVDLGNTNYSSANNSVPLPQNSWISSTLNYGVQGLFVSATARF